MKEMDCVEVAVEKKRYAKEGVHQGMQGWICHAKSVQVMTPPTRFPFITRSTKFCSEKCPY